MLFRSRDRLGADVGISTTGVAGPEPQDGRPVGEVYVAVATRGAVRVESLNLDPTLGRSGIRAATVDAALMLLADVLTSDPHESAATE